MAVEDSRIIYFSVDKEEIYSKARREVSGDQDKTRPAWTPIGTNYRLW
jgi:hypothetical protein